MERERRDSQRPGGERTTFAVTSSGQTSSASASAAHQHQMYPPPPPPAGTASATTSRAGSALPGLRPQHAAHSSSAGGPLYPPQGQAQAQAGPLPPLGSMPPPPSAPGDRGHSKVDHRERERMERERERSIHHQQQQQDPRLVTRERSERDPRDPRDRERERERDRERERERDRPQPIPRAPSVVRTTPRPPIPQPPPSGVISPRAAAPPALIVSAGTTNGVGLPLAPASGPAAPHPPPPVPVPSVHAIQEAIVKGTEAALHALAQANEQTWLLIGACLALSSSFPFFLWVADWGCVCEGAVSEQLNDTDRANAAYEHALRHNPTSVSALTQVAGMARVKEDFHKVRLYLSSFSPMDADAQAGVGRGLLSTRLEHLPGERGSLGFPRALLSHDG